MSTIQDVVIKLELNKLTIGQLEYIQLNTGNAHLANLVTVELMKRKNDNPTN